MILQHTIKESVLVEFCNALDDQKRDYRRPEVKAVEAVEAVDAVVADAEEGVAAVEAVEAVTGVAFRVRESNVEVATRYLDTILGNAIAEMIMRGPDFSGEEERRRADKVRDVRAACACSCIEH